MSDSGKPRGRGPGRTSTATAVRERVLGAPGDSYFSTADFTDLPAGAVMHALSRLAAEGAVVRARKGVYYRPTRTVLGQSVPSSTIATARMMRAPLYPAGLTAANELGLTTQNPGLVELATTAPTAPSGLGHSTVRTRRSPERVGLSRHQAALLEVLRDRAMTSDLSPDETATRLRSLISAPGAFEQLARVAATEPPRVRAMLGALGEEAGASERDLQRLRSTLNPLSRFDFGPLRTLKNARRWQAK